ncbi:winged helix-turn-helix domain-containing protein [Streptomyces sp. NPDC086519]|uniref:winged helix-turn-helix domain-containing protein n=1 Tax=Streptomyces sp. NPDC086519 TaxID=3154863 RepID=UPI003415E83D
MQTRLAAWLKERPATHSRIDDHAWTTARARPPIRQKFHTTYSISDPTRLPRRTGFRVRTPAQPATEHDDDAIPA